MTAIRTNGNTKNPAPAMGENESKLINWYMAIVRAPIISDKPIKNSPGLKIILFSKLMANKIFIFEWHFGQLNTSLK